MRVVAGLVDGHLDCIPIVLSSWLAYVPEFLPVGVMCTPSGSETSVTGYTSSLF